MEKSKKSKEPCPYPAIKTLSVTLDKLLFFTSISSVQQIFIQPQKYAKFWAKLERAKKEPEDIILYI